MTDGRVTVVCDHCNEKLRLPTGRSGEVKCPHCNNLFTTDTFTAKLKINEWLAMANPIVMILFFLGVALSIEGVQSLGAMVGTQPFDAWLGATLGRGLGGIGLFLLSSAGFAIFCIFLGPKVNSSGDINSFLYRHVWSSPHFLLFSCLFLGTAVGCGHITGVIFRLPIFFELAGISTYDSSALGELISSKYKAVWPLAEKAAMRFQMIYGYLPGAIFAFVSIFSCYALRKRKPIFIWIVGSISLLAPIGWIGWVGGAKELLMQIHADLIY
ncbi:zinc-ribbon domain-containing protein [Gammaproteobacteria bacterium]|nr:zinc-ribbon domain-containing protein [Gammaproteobacteria bacterium]